MIDDDDDILPEDEEERRVGEPPRPGVLVGGSPKVKANVLQPVSPADEAKKEALAKPKVKPNVKQRHFVLAPTWNEKPPKPTNMSDIKI